MSYNQVFGIIFRNINTVLEPPTVTTMKIELEKNRNEAANQYRHVNVDEFRCAK